MYKKLLRIDEFNNLIILTHVKMCVRIIVKKNLIHHFLIVEVFGANWSLSRMICNVLTVWINLFHRFCWKTEAINIKTSNLFISVPSHSLDSQINLIYIRVLQCLSYMENHWVYQKKEEKKRVSLRFVWWFFYKNKTHYIHNLNALMILKRKMREIFVCVFSSTSHLE